MEDSEYDNIAALEENHWWYRGMARLSDELVAREIKEKRLKILDAGCGTGGMLRRLGRDRLSFGIDFSPLALAHTQRTTSAPLCRASITHLPFAPQSFNLITSFDVLYHQAVLNDELALQSFYRALPPQGWVLIRVPAFEALRGAHDLTVHTRHRYTAAELRQKLEHTGFKVKRLTYANFFLFLPIYCLRALQSSQHKTESSDVELPQPLVNSLLEFILRVETWLIRFVNLPFGVSLFALAQKP